MDILTAVQSKGIELKRVATTNGGEYAGPCPVCGGKDRFRVWPAKKGTEGGAWWCRSEEKSGDLIEFFRWAHAMSYGDACRAAGTDPKSYTYAKPSLPSKGTDQGFQPRRHPAPAEAWADNAAKFVAACHQALLNDPAELDRLRRDRGIRIETVRRFRLGINGADFYRPRETWGLPEQISKQTGKPKKLWIPRGLVIPCMAGEAVTRIRIRRPGEDLRSETDPRYYFVPGSSPAILRIGDRARAYVVVESELDALLIAQEAGDLAGAVAMGTSSAKPDADTFAHLAAADVILLALDADAAGERGSSWWLDHFAHAERWPVPDGKDPGDIHRDFDLRAWVLAGLPAAWHVAPPDGPFALHGSQDGGAGSDQDAQAAAAECLPDPGADLPATVLELGELLCKVPVRIVSTAKRTAIEQRPEWTADPDWRRISDLVFFDPDCSAHLAAHPLKVIDGNNFFMTSIDGGH